MKRDSHIHTLKISNLPDNMLKFFPSWAERVIGKSKLLRLILRISNPFSKQTELDHYANFLKFQNMTVHDQVKKHLRNCFNIEGDLVGINILTVDLEWMKRGSVKEGLEDQLKKAISVKKRYAGGIVKIFMGIDPRRPDLIDLVHKYIDQVDGFKLYCYNGFFPYDSRLNLFYKIAEANKKPCIYHCSDTNINYYGGKDIKNLLKESKFDLLPKRKGNKKLSTNFCNPLGYEYVAKKYPDLPIIIAHWGGNDMLNGDRFYNDEITRIILENKNAYVDTSFFCHETSAVNFILYNIIKHPEIIDKIFFGTDFPMSESVSSIENMFELKKKMEKRNWNKILTNFDNI